VKDMTEQPRAKRSAAETRSELLAAAAELLLVNGSESKVSVDDVVKVVGVTPPMLYRHFADKQALFAEVYAQRMLDFQAALQTAASTETDPVRRLEARGRKYVRYAVENPDSYRAVFMALDNLGGDVFAGGGHDADSAYSDLVADVQSCIAAGRFDDRDPQLMARVIWSNVHGLSSMLLAMPTMIEPFTADDVIEESVAAITRGFARTTE